MPLERFESELAKVSSNDSLLNFCRLRFIHGTPFVFEGREADYFKFKNKIATKYDISHTEVFIVGSAKLGFSPIKRTEFSLESDIDIAIVSEALSNSVLNLGLEFEYKIRASEIAFRVEQMEKYHSYLRYGALGWIRPDLLPSKPPIESFKNDWFDFFKSISFGNSEVGNYKVSAGLFRTQRHLERYTLDSLQKIKRKMEVNGAK